MPLQRRVPKFGFKNINRIEYKSVNLDSIIELAEEFKVEKINHKILFEKGLISKNDKVKILGRGKEDFKIKIEIEANAFSKTAENAIEKNGGVIKII